MSKRIIGFFDFIVVTRLFMEFLYLGLVLSTEIYGGTVSFDCYIPFSFLVLVNLDLPTKPCRYLCSEEFCMVCCFAITVSIELGMNSFMCDSRIYVSMK